MSAFVVSTEHIDAIVSVAIHGPKDSTSRWEQGPSWAEGDPRVIPWQEQIWRKVATGGLPELAKPNEIGADDLGAMLLAENVASVNYRYDEIESRRPEYRYRKPSRRPTVVEAFKLLGCLDYQSCEHPEWINSQAYRFCLALQDALIGCLPGYSAAPWEWSTPVT